MYICEQVACVPGFIHKCQGNLKINSQGRLPTKMNMRWPHVLHVFIFAENQWLIQFGPGEWLIALFTRYYVTG